MTRMVDGAGEEVRAKESAVETVESVEPSEIMRIS